MIQVYRIDVTINQSTHCKMEYFSGGNHMVYLIICLIPIINLILLIICKGKKFVSLTVYSTFIAFTIRVLLGNTMHIHLYIFCVLCTIIHFLYSIEEHDRQQKYCQNINVWSFAKQNGIAYKEEIKETKIVTKNKHMNEFYLAKGKYLFLYPKTFLVEWYTKSGGKLVKVLDNQDFHVSITNFDNIVHQILSLYEKYKTEDVFIDVVGFALELEEPICPNYCGKAKLVITDRAIVNRDVRIIERRQEKSKLLENARSVLKTFYSD